MTRRVILVAGPPCSGKTTYVRQRAKPGDLVLDQDQIGPKAMGQGLARVTRMTDGTAWVIRCAPGRQRREQLASRIGVTNTVLLVPPYDELHHRATQRADTKRALASIRKWYEVEQQNPAPRIRRGPTQQRGSTTERGYGWRHMQLRRALLPDAYGKPCPHCGQIMQRGQKLDLDHTPDRTGYRGMAHSSCNRTDGAKRGNARRAQRPPSTSRAW